MATMNVTMNRAGVMKPSSRPAFTMVTPRARAVTRRLPMKVFSMLSSSSTSNPAFTMGNVQEAMYERRRAGDIMTVDGAVQKSAVLLAVTFAAAAATWVNIFTGNAVMALGAAKIAGIGGLVTALATMFKPQWSPVTAPTYALFQGVAMAGLSAIYELKMPGIVMNATMLTFGILATLLFAFQARVITVDDKFRDGVIMVTGGYMIMMLGGFLLSLCGVALPAMFTGGPVAIGIGLVAAGLAAANLLLDFDMIKSAASSRSLPKWFEWYSGFSLLVTLVWMYTSILRLLSLLTGGDRD